MRPTVRFESQGEILQLYHRLRPYLKIKHTKYEELVGALNDPDRIRRTLRGRKEKLVT